MCNNRPMPKKEFKAITDGKGKEGPSKPAGIREKVIHILDFYTLVAQNTYPSVRQLSERFGLTERSIYRYREIINFIDPMEYDRERGGYRFVNSSRIKKMSLSNDDFLLLMALGETVAHLGTPLNASFHRFLSSFLNMAASSGSRISRQILVKLPDASENEKLNDYFGRIVQAIEEKRSIDVLYKTLRTGKTGRRRIDPYGIVFYEGSWVLTGYCHARESIRNFAIDSMEDLKVTNYFFKPDTAFDLKEHFAASWGIYNEDLVDVTVRFTARVADYILRKKQWHPSERRNVLPDGSVELTFTLAGVDEIKRWIYSWVPNVQVIAPESFRERMKREFSEATRLIR